MIVSELCEREVVEVSTGENLGHVDDIAFVPETAAVTPPRRPRRTQFRRMMEGGLAAAARDLRRPCGRGR